MPDENCDEFVARFEEAFGPPDTIAYGPLRMDRESTQPTPSLTSPLTSPLASPPSRGGGALDDASPATIASEAGATSPGWSMPAVDGTASGLAVGLAAASLDGADESAALSADERAVMSGMAAEAAASFGTASSGPRPGSAEAALLEAQMRAAAAAEAAAAADMAAAAHMEAAADAADTAVTPPPPTPTATALASSSLPLSSMHSPTGLHAPPSVSSAEDGFQSAAEDGFQSANED